MNCTHEVEVHWKIETQWKVVLLVVVGNIWSVTYHSTSQKTSATELRYKLGHNEKLYFSGSWKYLQCNLWPFFFKKNKVMMIKESLEFFSGSDLVSKQIYQWNYSWTLGHSEKLYIKIFAVQPTIFLCEKTRSSWQKRSLEFFSSPDLYFQNSFLSVLYIEKEKENSSQITKKQRYKGMKILKIWLFMWKKNWTI